jgi:putative membrane protein
MFEPRWRREGREPDYRFSLANERTFLAWIRTGLGVLAGGILLDQFATRLAPRIATLALAVALCLLAALLCGLAYWRWRGNEIAMRHDLALPNAGAIPLLAVSACVMALAVALMLLPW